MNVHGDCCRIPFLYNFKHLLKLNLNKEKCTSVCQIQIHYDFNPPRLPPVVPSPTWAMSSLPGQLWSLNQLKKLWYPPLVERLKSLEPVRLCPRCHRMGLDMDTGEPERWEHSSGSWVRISTSTRIGLYSLLSVEGLMFLPLQYMIMQTNAL